MQAHFNHIPHSGAHTLEDEIESITTDQIDPESLVTFQSTNNHGNPEVNPTRCRIDKHALLYSAMWIAPVINATNLASQALVGLRSNGKPFPQAVSLSVFAFFNSLAMAGKVTVENMEDTVKAIRNRELPEDMVDQNMSPKKRKALIFLGLAIAIYVASADGVLSKFFADEVPDDLNFSDQIDPSMWDKFSIFLASATAVSIAFGEGLETVAGLQELFGDKGIEYHNSISKWVSRAIGGLGGLFGSGQDILANFIGMQSVFKIASTSWWLLPVGMGGMLNGLTDFSLNGRFNIKNIDALYKTISTRYPTAKESISFLIAATVGGIAAYTTNSLISSFFGTLKETYNIDNEYYDYTATAFSYGAPANDFMTYTGAAYPLAYFAVNKFTNSISSLFSYCCGYGSNNKPSPDTEERKPLLEDQQHVSDTEEVEPQTHTNSKEESREARREQIEYTLPLTDTKHEEIKEDTESFFKQLEKHGGLFQEPPVTFNNFKRLMGAKRTNPEDLTTSSTDPHSMDESRNKNAFEV
jgi:hypothetical protein